MTTQQAVCLTDRNWFVNSEVRACTAEERIVWLELLMHMSKAEPRGMLAKPLERIAMMAGTSTDVLRGLIANGLLKGHDGAGQGDTENDGSSSLPFVFRPSHAGKFGDPVVLVDLTDGPMWYCDWMVLETHRSKKASSGVRAAIELRAQIESKPAGSAIAISDMNSAEGARASAAAAPATGSETEDETVEEVGGRKVPNCPQARLIDLYHRVIPSAKKVVVVGAGNQLSKGLKARWRSLAVAPEGRFTGYESAEAGLAKWKAIFEHVARSRFLMGLVPGRPGEAPFEVSLVWLIGPVNMEKVLNGVYNRTPEERGEPGGEIEISGMHLRVRSGVEQVMAMHRRRQGVVVDQPMQESLPL
ncbi:hypothetical protein [Ottowia sp.]|uniref:hypothetical protein n=1 Tax=Ottowia sp. TaxID=1898956 RepID=UPI0025D6CCCE|nr:hypothetical protein [Ottowia sp.]MBK6616109.1 hypothetical protein [Ottowia sp.]